ASQEGDPAEHHALDRDRETLGRIVLGPDLRRTVRVGAPGNQVLEPGIYLGIASLQLAAVTPEVGDPGDGRVAAVVEQVQVAGERLILFVADNARWTVQVEMPAEVADDVIDVAQRIRLAAANTGLEDLNPTCPLPIARDLVRAWGY